VSTFVKGAKVKPAEQHVAEQLNLEAGGPAKIEVGNQGGMIGTDNERQIDRRNQIADSADEFRKGDLQDLDGDPVARPRQEEEEEEEEEARVEAAEPEKPRTFKIKVNGREMELTEAEMIERAQKVESADQYLQTAAEAVRNATKPALPVQDEPAQVEEDDLALARALQMGSEEDAAKAIRRIRAKPSEVTPDVLPRLVDERLQFLKAVESFNAEYKDYLEVPSLRQKANEIDARLAQSEPSLPYAERLKKVGEEVKKEALSIVQKFGTPKVDKAARKASVAPVPSAAGRQSQMSDDEGEESPESVIAAMAKLRGQGRPVSH
jgi:hypothetical protein